MKIEQITAQLGERDVSVTIYRKAIKHTYIRVKPEGIVVSTHRLTPTFHILKLLHDYRERILRQMDTVQFSNKANEHLTYLGQPITIRWENGVRYSHRWLNKETVLITYPEEKQREYGLNAFIRIEAKKVLPKRFEQCLAIFQRYYPINPPELRLRKMRSRFGSCYYKKARVILNTMLIRFREELIDLVIFHELCHFVHPNHSPQFYETLSQFVPHHRQLQKELNEG